MFLSVVTLKIRLMSQSPNQGFSMSECCIYANFGQNPVIYSGYIVPYIFKVHANINAETDADRIRIKDNFLWEYMNCHIVYFPFVAHFQGKKIQSI